MYISAFVYYKWIFFRQQCVVQKLKSNKIPITVPRQQYCVMTGENKKSYAVTVIAKTKKLKNIKVNFYFGSF